MPRSEGIETFESFVHPNHPTLSPERMPRSEGIETVRRIGRVLPPHSPERMPRSEGIETCPCFIFFLTLENPERMPRSEGIETRSRDSCRRFSLLPRNECPDQRGLRLIGKDSQEPQDASPERMPRSEGIETVTIIQREQKWHTPGTNAPIRGD